MCQHCNNYKYLEPRPDNWRKQLWIEGRNMTVWHLVSWMRATGMDPAEVAQDGGLPLEAVLEAIDYYQRHRDIVESDNEAEKRYLLERGYKLD